MPSICDRCSQRTGAEPIIVIRGKRVPMTFCDLACTVNHLEVLFEAIHGWQTDAERLGWTKELKPDEGGSEN